MLKLLKVQKSTTSALQTKAKGLNKIAEEKKNQQEDLQKHLPTKNQVLSCALNRNMHCQAAH
jgi:hypothetical protein